MDTIRENDEMEVENPNNEICDSSGSDHGEASRKKRKNADNCAGSKKKKKNSDKSKTRSEKWILSPDEGLARVALKMKDKFDKYWGDPVKMNMNLYLVVVLDPRHKMKYVTFTLKRMYNDELATEIGRRVTKALEESFEDYKKLYGPPRPSSQEAMSSMSSVLPTDDTISQEMLEVMAEKEREYREQCILEDGDLDNSSELDIYLSEKKEKNLPGFDILGWWKVNSIRFPILSKLARDLLAMPISTVASESTFSTSGRIIDDFRASLTPRMAQALVCTQDWLRNGSPKLPIEEEYEVLESVEEDAMSTGSGTGDSVVLSA